MRIVLLLLFFTGSTLFLHRRQALRPRPVPWSPAGDRVDFFEERRGALR